MTRDELVPWLAIAAAAWWLTRRHKTVVTVGELTPVSRFDAAGDEYGWGTVPAYVLPAAPRTNDVSGLAIWAAERAAAEQAASDADWARRAAAMGR